MAACLKNEKIAAWVNPLHPDDDRPQFDPQAFVAGKHTLYALSKEGAGTAGPLVTALTVATVTAAEEHAVTQRGGRLSTPMLCVLDEAANVCRWMNLPTRPPPGTRTAGTWRPRCPGTRSGCRGWAGSSSGTRWRPRPARRAWEWPAGPRAG